jgi:hypothetical protein
MAKYSRFDPRNRKKNRHKNQYLGRQVKRVRRELDQDDLDLQKYYESFRAK